MSSSGNQQNSKSRYGVISMIGIIMGTVMGSGIYIKNESLMEGTNSSLYSIIGWVIGGLIVLAMLISFIEIASITTKRNEQGTFANWSRHLWGEKTSKFIGGYFTLFYYPMVIAAETIFSSEQLFKIDANESWFGSNPGGAFGGFFVITIISLFFLFLAYVLVLVFVSAGKRAQIIGTIIKVTPLLIIIFLAFLGIAGMTFGGPFDGDTNEIFDMNSEINSSHEGIVSILLIMPSILFAFDGFLFASSLSNEAKKPSTYKTGAIISIFLITMIYIMFSLSTYLLSDVSVENGTIDSTKFGINAVIHNLFSPEVANVIGTITMVIISISILTATLGYGISSMWTVADGSNTEEIYDRDGEYLKRNKTGIPIGAGIFILKRSIFMILLMRLSDLVALSILIGLNGDYIYSYSGMTSFYSDLFTLFNFSAYSFIILGGIKNRFTKENEVEKNKVFLPFSFFALISMVMIVFVFGGDIITGIISSFDSSNWAEIGIAAVKIVIIGLFIGIYLFYVLHNEKKLTEIKEEELFKKDLFKRAYMDHLTPKEFIEQNNIDISKYELENRDLITIDDKIKEWILKT